MGEANLLYYLKGYAIDNIDLSLKGNTNEIVKQGEKLVKIFD